MQVVLQLTSVKVTFPATADAKSQLFHSPSRTVRVPAHILHYLEDTQPGRKAGLCPTAPTVFVVTVHRTGPYKSHPAWLREGGRRRGAKSGITPVIMYFTAAAL